MNALGVEEGDMAHQRGIDDRLHGGAVVSGILGDPPYARAPAGGGARSRGVAGVVGGQGHRAGSTGSQQGWGGRARGSAGRHPTAIVSRPGGAGARRRRRGANAPRGFARKMRALHGDCGNGPATIMNVLLTGGTGYIGSLTCVRLIEAGETPVIVDNLVNSKPAVLDRIAAVTGVRPAFFETDIRDRNRLDALLARHHVDAVIHFAGLKAVGESVQDPLRYYDNNVHGSRVLLSALQDAGVRTIVFSSSATVYGAAQVMPITEDAPTQATNPYGRTKLFVEEMLGDLAVADPAWSVTLLRYFNPVGAHPSGLLGEDPQGVPNNLMPFIAQVAVGRLDRLTIFGADYPTPDGTGVRDYIHVLDLVDGHVAALRHRHGRAGVRTYNLGTGRGHSVMEALRAFERASGRPIAHVLAPRRAGDVASCWADASRAGRELGWRALRSL